MVISTVEVDEENTLFVYREYWEFFLRESCQLHNTGGENWFHCDDPKKNSEKKMIAL